MSAGVKQNLSAAAFGITLGFTLNRTGFSNFEELHKMLTFDDLRLLFTFMASVTVLLIGFRFLENRCCMAPRPIHKGSIIGGILFGIGWAVTGACPSVPLVQIGEGRLWGLYTLAGIAAGTALYEFAHRTWFRWDRGSC